MNTASMLVVLNSASSYSVPDLSLTFGNVLVRMRLTVKAGKNI